MTPKCFQFALRSNDKGVRADFIVDPKFPENVIGLTANL